LFLDEPTTGVDPVSRKEFWEMLKRLKKDGITIMVSTPYMDEAGKCDRIALMKDGKFLKIDTPRNIVGSFRDTLLAVVGPDMPRLLADIRKIPYVKRCFAFGDTHHVVFENPKKDQENVHDKEWSVMLKHNLMEMGHIDLEVYGIEPGVEDCFMALDNER
jgi:ABC-type multidrug transport system ATPase subunit